MRFDFQFIHQISLTMRKLFLSILFLIGLFVLGHSSPPACQVQKCKSSAVQIPDHGVTTILAPAILLPQDLKSTLPVPDTPELKNCTNKNILEKFQTISEFSLAYNSLYSYNYIDIKIKPPESINEYRIPTIRDKLWFFHKFG